MLVNASVMGDLSGKPVDKRNNRRHMRRLASVLPQLMEEFHASRDSKEVLDCADAVLAYYEKTVFLWPSLRNVRCRTSECLRAGVCEGIVST